MKTRLPSLLSAVIRDYFMDHLPRLRGTSPHTIHNYRDSIVPLLRFLSRQRSKPVTSLGLTDLDPPGSRATRRGSSPAVSYSDPQSTGPTDRYLRRTQVRVPRPSGVEAIAESSYLPDRRIPRIGARKQPPARRILEHLPQATSTTSATRRSAP
jgi:site-specific recombinase XerC